VRLPGRHAAGLSRQGEGLAGRFDPPWDLRRPDLPSATPDRAVVIGGGLAGAAVASSLARRGWQVDVLDAAQHPAAGASSLPAGLLAPHTSPDDNLLSRTRAALAVRARPGRLGACA
jgi:tRNA 5-methylaminomethyl-2-thiouridine biosynthesis bifunctional protein